MHRKRFSHAFDGIGTVGAILIALGVIIFLGAVYYLAIDGTSNNDNANSNVNQDTGNVNREAAGLVRVDLKERNNSEQSGTATFVPVDSETRVSITLAGTPVGAAQPAGIAFGTCDQPGDTAYELNDVVDGFSETTLATTTDELLARGPFALVVRRAGPSAGEPVACGILDAARVDEPPQPPITNEAPADPEPTAPENGNVNRVEGEQGEAGEPDAPMRTGKP